VFNRQSGRAQRREECLGNGKRCGADGIAGLEQGGDAGMVLQGRPQPAREGADLCGPGRAGICLAVDLGEHRVEARS
jgi:hypothetical protein